MTPPNPLSWGTYFADFSVKPQVSWITFPSLKCKLISSARTLFLVITVHPLGHLERNICTRHSSNSISICTPCSSLKVLPPPFLLNYLTWRTIIRDHFREVHRVMMFRSQMRNTINPCLFHFHTGEEIVLEI